MPRGSARIEEKKYAEKSHVEGFARDAGAFTDGGSVQSELVSKRPEGSSPTRRIAIKSQRRDTRLPSFPRPC